MGEGWAKDRIGGFDGRCIGNCDLCKKENSMGENSKIEWCHHTFNPVIGCAKVSAGCKHCYAEAMMDHWGKAKWGPTARRVRTSAATWRKPLQWNATARAQGRRYRVFCASLADVFEDHADWEQPRRDLLRLIVGTPHLDWLLLTKRPENVCALIEQATGFSDAEMWFHGLGNVWIGTSVEDQEAADTRIPELLKIPAPVRFLSCEPLLGPVNLWEYDEFNGRLDGSGIIHDYRWQPSTVDNYQELVGCSYPGISWVIAGGESGHHARPMNPDWARSLRDQCQVAGVSFFFKQWGTAAKKQKFGHGVDVEGRLLDGCEWSEFPQTEVTC